MVSERDRRNATAGEDDGEYEELAADAGDETMIRRQAERLADVAQPEAVGSPGDVGDASPEVLELPGPYGGSIDQQVRGFDDTTAEADRDVTSTDPDRSTRRVREQLDGIEREMDEYVEDADAEAGVE
jgi:hypothetical protein